jgi:Tol biopolymer transport system component
MTPAPSPDGTKIAFTSDRDGNYEIYVMNADGTGATRLTTNAAMDVGPTWSPDGRKIAFMSDRDGDGEIYVMNADGSSVVQLTTNAASDGSPAWSPNGKQIAFASERDGNREIYVMNADGSGQTRLTNDPAYDDEPAWAPKGRARIAFESDRRLTDDDDIFVMGADGSRPVDVTPNNPSLDFESAWSPDARKIAFAGFLPGNAASIFVMNADGSGRTLLGPGEDPAWLP